MAGIWRGDVAPVTIEAAMSAACEIRRRVLAIARAAWVEGLYGITRDTGRAVVGHFSTD